MIIQETEIGRTDPLSTEARARAERDQQNIHITARQVDAENADTATLNEGEQAARSDLAKAETQRLRAEAALRKQLAAKTEYQNRLQSIVVLKGEIGLASLANSEYQSCITNAASNFETWPFQVGQNNNRFGLWAASFASQISVAREMVLLLPGWIKSAQERLATMEKEAEQFHKTHKLE